MDDKRFYGQRWHEVLVRVLVYVGIVLAYADPLLYRALCHGGQ